MIAMYIEKVPNRNSPPAVLLRESYREGDQVKKRTLANLSKLPDDIIDNLKLGLFWFLCGNEVYTDSLFDKIVLKVLPDKYFTIP
ncbi:hypothetical protein MAESPC_03465 [Microcystis aeruginosa SPC777]|uniref:Uncharacterized protein n=1 Tax=Microcystis aeruginosa SPC777 TaxID=482300 RepID=S3J237_MICAE|nr:hypothetical protein MAESPC_03465 [Microcystis aeruginosa SPC777]